MTVAIPMRSVWHGEVLVTRPVMMADIKREYAMRFGVTVADLEGPDRRPPIAHLRQECMAACRATGRWSLKQIGRAFGDRDHTTVLHAIRRVAERAEQGREQAA